MAGIGEWDGVGAGPVDIVGSRRLVEVDGLIAALELRLSTSEIDRFRPFFSSGTGTMSLALPDDTFEKRVSVQL